MHQYYADSRTILSDLFSLLRDVPPGSRHGLRPVDLPGLHWMFAP